MPTPVRPGKDPVIVARGALIALLAFGIGFLPGMPADSAVSHVTLIGIGIVLQLAIIAARYLARRHELEHGGQNALVPVVMRVGTLFADGLTVLMCGFATFGAWTAQLQAI